MPQKKNSARPPAAMTWAKASPVLIIAVIFDALRLLFEMFWFFGPALGAIACTVGVNQAVGTTVANVGGKAVAGGCTLVAGVVGFFGSGAIEIFGIVMAMAIGFLGWMTIGLITLTTNARIFKEHKANALWFVGSLLIGEIPLVGGLPALTGATLKMYHSQIKKEKSALKAYQKEHANEQLQERQQQAVQLMQIQQQAQLAEFQEQEAANDAEYEIATDEESARDDEIHDEVREAA